MSKRESNQAQTVLRGAFSALSLSGKRALPAVLPAIVLAGATAFPGTKAIADSHPAELHDTRAQLMYEIMIAELAGRRGYLDVATDAYLSAARRTDDPRVAERATQLAVWARQWASAEEAARRWLDLDPESSDARELLAQVLIRSEQPAGATLDEFARLVESSDEPNTVLRDIYVLLSRESDQTQAFNTLRGLQDRFPQYVEAHMGVGRWLYQQNERTPALEAVDQALEVDPLHSEALLTKAQILSDFGRPTEGLIAIRDALKTEPDNTQLRLGYARLLSSVGRYNAASNELEILFDENPGEPDVLLSIGLIALDAKRTDSAQRYLEALRETGEHRDQAYFYLGRIDDQKQEYESAIRHYEKVSEGDLYLSAQLRSAELHAAIGKLDIGIEKVRSLSALLPDPAMQAMLITTESRMLQEAGRNEDAVGVLSAGLKKYPDNSELLYARALASDRTGDTETLIADLMKLIESEPNNANALNALGYFLADDNQRLDEAEQHLEKAIALKPNDPAIMDSLGWLRFRQGDYATALKLLKQAYELLPDGEIAAHLGEVLWVQGNKQEAQSVWDKALLESPEHPKLLDTVERLTQ